MKRNITLKIIYCLFIILVSLTILFMLLGIGSRDIDYSFDADEIYDWSSNWEWCIPGSSYEKIDLPIKLDVEQGQTLTIQKTLGAKDCLNNCLMFESKRQDVLIYVGDELRGIYTADPEVRKGASLPYAYVTVPLRSEDVGKTVMVQLSSDSFYSGNIGGIYIGDEMSLILTLIKSNILWLSLVIILFIIGIISFICYIIYKRTFSESLPLIYIFWFALFASIWCFSQLKVRQVFIKDVPLLESIGYCAFLLVPIPIVINANIISGLRRSKLYEVFLVITMLAFVFQNVLHTTGGFDYFELQSVSQLVFLAEACCIIVFTFIDIKKYKSKRLYIPLVGLLMLMISIVAEALCLALNINYSLCSLYLTGSFLYTGAHLIYVFVTVSIEQQKKKDAENANKAKSQFLATMSHEIRTPINVVLGMNEMIIRESSESKIKEYATSIADAGKALLSLVNDILDFSKIESGRMDIIDVEYQMKSLISDLVLMAQGRMTDTKLSLSVEVDESLPSVYYGDEIRIKQIITNLLTNAIKYSEEGTITLSVKNDGVAGDYINLYISVSDNGIGIREEDIERLFNSSFIRVDEVRNRNIEGTGLGLAITRRLLELMDSRLEVSSDYGHGSVFGFRIRQKIINVTPIGPINNQKGPRKKWNNTFVAPKASILAVDDTKTNLMVIKGLLKIYQIDVETCSSGEECLELCHDKKYDLIFMDHMMPGMDGIETLQYLRKDEDSMNHDTCVVALTANAVSGACEMYRESGFDGYITKPIDINELDTCLSELLASELIQNI